MKSRILLLALTAMLFLIDGCKKDKDNTDDKSSFLFQSFQMLELATNRMITIGDSLNLEPREALEYIIPFLKQQADVQNVLLIDNSCLVITTTGGFRSSIFINETASDGLSLYRGGPGGQGAMFKTYSQGGNCSNKIEGKKVLLYAAYHEDFYKGNEFQEKVADVIKAGNADIDVKVLKDLECTSDVLSTFNQYGLVIIDSHGSLDGTYIGTRFSALVSALPNNKEALKDFYLAKLGNANWNYLEEKQLTVAVVLSRDTSLPVDWAKYRDTRKYALALTAKGVRELIPNLSGTIVFSNACYSGWSSATYIDKAGQTNDVDPIQPAWLSKSPVAYYGYNAGTSPYSYKVPNLFAKKNEDTLVHSFFHDGDSTGNAHLHNGTAPFGELWTPKLFHLDYGVLKLQQYASPAWCYGNCGDTLIDDRDQQKYPTQCIGDQVWMAKNLNWAGAGVCYDNNTSSCNTYGRLYKWSEVTGGASSNSSPSGIRGICPTGWHIPSLAEWQKLIAYAGGDNIAGDKLRANSPLWVDDPPGTDNYGFAAVPSGQCQLEPTNDYDCFNEDADAYFWTSSKTSFSPNPPQYIMVSGNYTGTHEQSSGYTDYFSCRCVKD